MNMRPPLHDIEEPEKGDPNDPATWAICDTDLYSQSQNL